MDSKEILEKTLKNIEKDRSVSTAAIGSLLPYLLEAPERHFQGGIALAKYIDQLQKSNDQLIKISTEMNKLFQSEDEEDLELDEGIFDQIKEAKEENAAIEE